MELERTGQNLPILNRKKWKKHTQNEDEEKMKWKKYAQTEDEKKMKWIKHT